MFFAVFALSLLLGFPAVCEAGYLLGRGRRSEAHPAELPHTMSWQAAMLGLAGLLIGFTFAMATTRYEGRKQVLIDETNAIDATYRRTQLLGEPAGEEVRTLLKRYVDGRIALFEVGMDEARLETIDRACGVLADQIWYRVSTAAHADPRSVELGLLVQSTNQMIELAASRRNGRENPVPWTVFLVLIGSSAVSMASIGYTCGLAGKRFPFGMLVMPVLVGAVVVLVFDIARPQVGLVRPTDEEMVRLRDSL